MLECRDLQVAGGPGDGVVIELGSPNWLLALALAALAGVLVWLLKRYLGGKAVWRYDPKAAWLRGCAFFCAGWAIAAAAGTLSTIADNPLVFAGQGSDWLWVASTAVIVAVVFVGYWIIWPIGTQSHGRKVVFPDTIVFGLLWGLTQGLLFASAWITLKRIVDPLLGDDVAGEIVLALLTILVLSLYQGLWHALYWDVHVSPEHNVIDWNTRKVAIVHNPNLILTTIWVTHYGNVGLWVLVETLALLGSCVTMPFPTFRRPLPADPIGPELAAPTDDPADLHGKTVVITGAANGIGRRVAAGLAARGARIVVVDVDGEGASLTADELARSHDVDTLVVTGDLGSATDVRRMAAEVLESCSRIDVLINNAGVFRPGYAENDDGHELTMAVNHLGSFLFTQLLLDRLVTSGARVLFVSSDAHRQARGITWDDMNSTAAWKGKTVNNGAGFAAYNHSKLALTATAMELADRTADTPMTVNVLTPGALVPTGIYDDLTGWFAAFVAVLRPVLRDVDKASMTPVYLASSPEVEGVTGWYWQDVRPKRESAVAQDPEVRRLLWEWSVDAVGLSTEGEAPTPQG